MCSWPALIPLAIARNSTGATLAHVQNLTAPGVHGVLHWWCDEQGHAAEPLCVRHEITLQISLAHGTERWQLQQRRHRLAGTSAAAELAGAIAAYCNGSATTELQRVSGVCKRAGAAVEPHVPMMEQLCASPRAPRARTHTTMSLRLAVLRRMSMHNWWCLQSGHSLSLSCQRHELQQLGCALDGQFAIALVATASVDGILLILWDGVHVGEAVVQPVHGGVDVTAPSRPTWKNA